MEIGNGYVQDADFSQSGIRAGGREYYFGHALPSSGSVDLETDGPLEVEDDRHKDA